MTKGIHTRRSVIGVTLGLGAAVAARLASAQEASPEATPAASGEWSFTDDKGVTVTLPSRPERLVIDVPEFRSTTAEQRAEVQAILDSIRLDPGN